MALISCKDVSLGYEGKTILNEVDFELNGGAWSWTAGTISDAAKGIDAVSNLPEIFMADFYAYLLEIR